MHCRLLALSGVVLLALPALARADNHAPHALLDPPSTDLRASMPSCFSGAGSSDDDGQVTGYAWDFGDASTGSGASACHTYARPGSYVVRLVVTDNQGATGSVTSRIDVRSLAPVAAFSQAGDHNAQELRFDASGSTDPDGRVVAYAWQFGDGAAGSGLNPVHRYTTPGTYHVTLTVTDLNGDTGSVAQDVPVTTSAPTATIGGSARRCAGERYAPSVTAADSDGHIADIRWDLDGKSGFELDTGTAPWAAVTFPAGTHHVAVQVTDDSGLTAEAAADLNFIKCAPVLHVPKQLRPSDRSVLVGLTCVDACTASVRLAANELSIGNATADLHDHGTANVRVKLVPGAAKRLKGQRRVSCVVQVSEAGGPVTTLKKQISVAATRASHAR